MPSFPVKHRAARSWQKISITVDARMTEAVSAYLADLTGTGLEFTSLAHDPTAEDRPVSLEKITAYIPMSSGEDNGTSNRKKIEELRLFLARASDIFIDCQAPLLQTEMLKEEDWGQNWKNFFTSLQITPSIIIKPSWENIEIPEEEGAGKIVIEIDPGLAFGTGHHPSTQLALTLLEELFRNREARHEKVLDVGTGSGILAMACGLLGAVDVLALDNDPDAVETARQNIIRNRLEDRITVSGQNPASLTGGFDIIAANITHDVLAGLAPDLAALLPANGFLVLSGILGEDQEYSMRGIFTQKGLRHVKSLDREEWFALLLQKL